MTFRNAENAFMFEIMCDVLYFYESYIAYATILFEGNANELVVNV